MNFLKQNGKYVFIFFFSFACMSFLLAAFDGDVLWNYGFSYAISKGEVPYRDFNMIVTPFYPMFMALFLKGISHNILVFYIINSLLITYMFSYLFKMYQEKAWLLLILLAFPIPVVIFPTYNLFLVFLVVLLLYLEKEKKSDYLIGVFLSLLFLTKQSVGLCMILPSFLYLKKDAKKLRKRLISFLGPIFIFSLYLFFTKSYREFLDLCFLGLFDFSTGNGKIFSIFTFFLLIPIFILLRRIKKDPWNIENYYVVCFMSIMIPLFDLPHFLYFMFAFSFLFLDKILLPKRQIIFNSILFSVVYSLLFFVFFAGYKNITYPNHYHNFEVRFLYNNNGEFIIRDELNRYIQENKDKPIVFLSSEAYFYKITNEMKINSFDLLNKGNHGYNGTRKMIEKIKEMDEDTLFIISSDEYITKDKYNRQQINKEIMEYVMKHGEKIREIYCFDIYKIHS